MWENVLKGKVPKKLRAEIENKLPQIEIVSFSKYPKSIML